MVTHSRPLFLAFFIGILLAPRLALAQAHSAHLSTDSPPAASSIQAESYHHDALELFVGESTRLGGKHGPHFTLGLDYEHRFAFWENHLGLGMMVDYERGEAGLSHEWLITPTVELHPLAHVKLFAGGGFCLARSELLPLLRLGGAYEIDLGHHWLIMPLLELDRTSTFTAVTSGLCLGFGQ
jgi:hypothetical protein